MKSYNELKTPDDAFAWMVECTLATVSWMNGLKSKKMSEFNRQIDIAQKGIDFWISINGKKLTGQPRMDEIIQCMKNPNIQNWLQW